MKSQQRYITLLMSLFIFGCASDNRRMSDEMTTTAKQFEEELVVTTPDISNIGTYEPLVVQKLKDFEDYINLLIDEKTELKFKASINEQIENFVTTKDSLSPEYVQLDNWLKQRLSEKHSIRFSNIKMLEESIKNEKEEFTFQVSLKSKIKHEKSQKTVFVFLLENIEKHFGSETISVSELRLIGLVEPNQ